MVKKILREIKYNKYNSFLEKLAKNFIAMDRIYSDIAGFYRFNCTGCKDNCCKSLFYHYTLLEYLYLQKGFFRLDAAEKNRIKKKAGDKTYPQSMCPVNFNGLCALYVYRPMICRLHGIPHILNNPNGDIIKNPGCETFMEKIKIDENYRLNRTIFYMNMAVLEKELRQSAGFSYKIKLTVAQMIELL